MIKTTLFVLIVALSSCSSTYYVVRHAEKEAASSNMTSDVPLSAMGQERAQALKSELQNKGIKRIYSTNYLRTKGTAQPLSDAIGVGVEVYNPGDTAFVRRLKELKKGNTLVVGHSNTVDDLVNGITGKNLLKDLPDTQYGDLFVIKKKGKAYQYEVKHFGK
jgi:2,3-bisphosphoglycerate-dependent phosphoglycerate mutase